MNLQLIHGSFCTAEAAELLHQLVQVKIRFLENRIEKGQDEADIKMLERRIKSLQDELQQVRTGLLAGGGSCELESGINITCT
ncbi:MAG TPA: hypothetical protein PKE63_03880 [Lacibacter sp.]|nr:hypothetical protein [Lacibacter sp.]HMO88472.1 hypothetical protein [Lacibacter sp.]HMP86390.1 hypothetical protein [Lacibacter sp.]